MKKTDFTSAQLTEQKTRYQAMQKSWLAILDNGGQPTEKDREFINSISYQFSSKGCLSEKQLAAGERIIARWSPFDTTKQSAAEASVLAVGEIIKDAGKFPSPVNFSDKKTAEILASGERQGWIRRISHTQIEWTETGVDFYRSELLKTEKEIETKLLDQFAAKTSDAPEVKCEVCRDDGGYYEDVVGDGGQKMWFPCEECAPLCLENATIDEITAAMIDAGFQPKKFLGVDYGFERGGLNVWQIREGWQVADLIDGSFQNHRPEEKISDVILKYGERALAAGVKVETARHDFSDLYGAEVNQILAEKTGDQKPSVRQMIAAFNKPYQKAVAIDCSAIGDDNDFSCWLSRVVFNLYQAGFREDALLLVNTDPMLNEPHTAESLAEAIELRVKFQKEEAERSAAQWQAYRD